VSGEAAAALGFVGLGAMGGRMAERLLDAGHAVTGYNRTAAKADWLVAKGLRLGRNPREVAAASEVIFTMVTDPAALEAVTEGADGILAGMRAGAVLIDMSTVSPEATRALAGKAAARGAHMLAAPVSGSPITLEAGQLSFMVGGDLAVLERVRPYLTAIGPTITHVGEIGLATSMKVATNLGLAVQMLAFCEAVALAEKAGIPRERAVEALVRSVIASPMVKYRAPFVLAMPAEALFDVPMIQKDLQLALDLGRQLGVPLPTTGIAQQMMTAARGLGVGHFDFAVVFDVIAALANIPPTRKPE
jgi:3-hydroxyisobutyrate dehydrogenase-like beta-hydroxyacid dehydrogenase